MCKMSVFTNCVLCPVKSQRFTMELIRFNCNKKLKRSKTVHLTLDGFVSLQKMVPASDVFCLIVIFSISISYGEYNLFIIDLMIATIQHLEYSTCQTEKHI